MAHQRDRTDPTLTQLLGRAWRALLFVLMSWLAWSALQAGLRHDVALTVAMVGVLLALSLALLASAIIAASASGSSQ